MKKIILVAAILLLTSNFLVLQAQQSLKIAAAVSQAASGKGLVVQIKILDSVNIVNQRAVNIMRRETSGNWTRLNATPVKRTSVVAGQDYSSKDKSFKRYADFILRKPATGSQERNIKGFTGIFLLNDNLFAQYAGCYFEDNAATPGTSYEYKLTDDGSGQDLSKPVAIKVSLQTGKAVTGLVFIQQQQNILLNWQADDRYYAYRVYRRPAPDAKPVLISKGPVAATKMNGVAALSFRFADKDMNAGTTWYYQVTAIDMLNNESAMSDPLKVTVKDATLPVAVNTVRNERDKKTFKITWVPVNDKNCVGYNIFRNSEPEPAFKKLNAQLLAPTTSTFSDLPAADGTVYNYYVESVGRNGNTSQSPLTIAVLPDRTAPAKPQHLKGISRPAIATLSWDKGTEKDLKGYWVFRASNRNKETMVLLNDSPLTTNYFSDSLPLVSTNEYVYCIQAIDNGYNKSLLSDTIILSVPDVTAPRIVQGLDAHTGPETVILQWRAVPDADVAGYTVYRSNDSAGKVFRPLNAALTKELRYTDHSDSAMLHYYITVTDRSGNISERSMVLAVAGITDTLGRQPAQDLSVTKNIKDNTINVSWRSLAKAPKGFIVFRKSSDEDSFLPVSPLLSEMKFTDSTAVAGEQYHYYVRTYFGNGAMRESVVVK
jgi:fibronectin type 3 domain-containing protein